MRLHHTGVVVRSLESAQAHYASVLGLRVVAGPVYDPAQDATLLMMAPPAGGPGIELIEAASDASRVAGHAARGGGLAHTCYEVDDLEQSVRTMRDAGALVVMDPTAAPLFDERRVAFLFLRSKHLIELVEV